MEEKEIYRCRGVMPKSDTRTFLELIGVVFLCFIIFHIGRVLPYGWFLQIGVLIASAVLINKILRQGIFVKTYVLYENRLSVLTRYGLIEKETESFPLPFSNFTKTTIIYEGKTYPFYPDENLLKHIKNISK